MVVMVFCRRQRGCSGFGFNDGVGGSGNGKDAFVAPVICRFGDEGGIHGELV